MKYIPDGRFCQDKKLRHLAEFFVEIFLLWVLMEELE
jgi:hypothetical protein